MYTTFYLSESIYLGSVHLQFVLVMASLMYLTTLIR